MTARLIAESVVAHLWRMRPGHPMRAGVAVAWSPGPTEVEMQPVLGRGARTRTSARPGVGVDVWCDRELLVVTESAHVTEHIAKSGREVGVVIVDDHTERVNSPSIV